MRQSQKSVLHGVIKAVYLFWKQNLLNSTRWIYWEHSSLFNVKISFTLGEKKPNIFSTTLLSFLCSFEIQRWPLLSIESSKAMYQSVSLNNTFKVQIFFVPVLPLFCKGKGSALWEGGVASTLAPLQMRLPLHIFLLSILYFILGPSVVAVIWWIVAMTLSQKVANIDSWSLYMLFVAPCKMVVMSGPMITDCCIEDADLYPKNIYIFFFKLWLPLPLNPCDDGVYNLYWLNLLRDNYFGHSPWEIDSWFSNGFCFWSVLKAGISESFFQEAFLDSLYEWENLHSPCQFAGVLPRKPPCL